MNFVNVFDQLANVALIARKCPSTTLRRAYVMALRDWCAQTQWLRENVTGSTVVGQQQYSLGDDPYIEIIGIAAMSGTDNSTPSSPQAFILRPSDSGAWPPNAARGRPTRYTYLPEAQFALWQPPDQVYGLTVTAIVQPKAEVGQIPEAPLLKYSSYLEAGALAYLLKIPGQPWTNLGEADKYDRFYRSGISNGKAEVQRNFNTGAQRVQPRAFVVGR